MTASFTRRPGAPAGRTAAPDPAFAARARLKRLRDALVQAAKALRPHRWNEPAVFFFDRTRQAELDAARPTVPDRFAELTALIAAELPALVSAVEVRRVARATDGLASAARALPFPAARELAELLAIPDDEVFLALAPAARTGVRLHLRGAADVAQLYRLLEEPNPPAPFPKKEGGERPAELHLDNHARERSFSPSPPGGGGRGVGFPSVQLFSPAALLPDGPLPVGFAGCEHWLWPTQPLAAVPRIGGERVVIVGPAVVRSALDIEPRFPGLAVECDSVQALNPFQVAEALARLCGRPVPVSAPAGERPVARAA